MENELKVVDGTTYLCVNTNDVNKGDLIIITYSQEDVEESSLNKIVWSNSIEFKYKPISQNKTYDFGFSTYRNMTDLTRYLGRKCKMELDVLFTKVIAIVSDSEIQVVR